jgi:hypothetical protein
VSARYSSEAAVAFAMHCDTNDLSYEEGVALASEVAAEVAEAAAERRSIPGIRRTGRSEA